MPPRSSARDSRYDDPYVFDEPYKSTSPPHNAYEYVGTEDPSDIPEHRQRHHSPVDEPRRRSSPSRSQARTTSPPRRHSRRGRDQTPPPAYARSPSPRRHRSARHTSPPPRASREALPHAKPNVQDKYHEFVQRPGVQRAQTYGKKGLSFLGEAAAAYYATQPPQDKGQRPRSTGGGGAAAAAAGDAYSDRERARRHRHRHDDSYYDSDGPPRRSHRHRRQHSPSASPSPPRRHRSERQSRRRDASETSSVSSRGYSRSRRGRQQHHGDRPRRRAYSYSPSPPPLSSSKGGRSSRKSGDYGSARSAAAPRTKSADAANERWQMAIRSALEAGGLAALRLRKQPGSWTGDKGARVAKAALGAAAMDAFIDSDPRLEKSHGVRGMAESAITGLLASKLSGKGPRKGKGRN